MAVCALQFIPVPGIRNPRTSPENTFVAAMQVPAGVQNTLYRSCMDCHSNQTHWPWYSRIAPVSWLIASDVRAARRVMNLSEWKTTAGRSAGTAIGTLSAACQDVRSGRMPKPRYLTLHPEAKLTPAEIQQFCEWTQVEITSLARERKARQQLSSAPAFESIDHKLTVSK